MADLFLKIEKQTSTGFINRSSLFFGYKSYFAVIFISTLLFCARPSEVELEATGCLLP